MSCRSEPAITIEEDPLGRALLEALIASQGLDDAIAITQGKVACSDISGAGRGLVATQTVPKDQVVVSVPWNAVITPSRAAELSSLGSLLKGATLPDWTLLALWLAELLSLPPSTNSTTNYTESSAMGDARSLESSRALHAAYHAVLPDATGCVLEWSDEEVAWLQGSHLYNIAVDIRNAADASWRELQPIAQQAEHDGLIAPGIITQATLRQAFSLLLSRLIRLDVVPLELGGGADSTVEVLCPWADLVNHSASASFLKFDQHSSCVTLAADKSYRPGDEITACYGQKTSGEMLLSYGFLPNEGTNPFDGCLLKVDLATFPDSEDKIRVLEARGMETTWVFPLRMGAVPQGLLEFAAFGALPLGDDTNTTSIAKAEQLFEDLLESENVGRKNIGAEAMQAGLESVIGLCKEAARGYKINLEQAKSELESLRKKGEGANNRKAAVLQVLINDQKVLARTSFLLKQQLKEMKPRR